MPLRVLFLCCALGLGAWAAEEPVPGEEQPPADEQEEQETDADAEARIETAEATDDESSETLDGESPDTFIPSEDISENIAVKYPVDI